MALDTTAVLKMLRRRIEHIDLVTSDLTDEELLAACQDAIYTLTVRLVPGLDAYTVGLDQSETTPAYGIAPDMEPMHAALVVVYAAASLLGDTYTARLFRGELGTSWTSGLEAESTISAEKAYRQEIDALWAELEELTAIHRRQSSGTRVQ